MNLIPLLLAFAPISESDSAGTADKELKAVVEGSSMQQAGFFIGTYTSPQGSKGIYRATLDTRSGALTQPELAVAAASPSFLALHPSGRYLYSTQEAIGIVGAYAIGPGMTLKKLKGQKSEGSSPCHVSIDPSGTILFVANYGGSVASLPILPSGALGPASSIYRNTGSGPNRNRQEGPHLHSIYPLGSLAYACDLGTDEVLTFKVAAGKLTPANPKSASVRPGSGPRHLAFAGGGKFAYANGEMSCSVTVFTRNQRTGTLRPIQEISTLPAGAGRTGRSTAEISVHPNGRWLYVSNRGHNSIAVFQILVSGKLKLLEVQSATVREPRHFAIDPTGKWLVVAGQSSNDLASMAIDQSTGKLTPTGSKVKVDKPVCVLFVR